MKPEDVLLKTETEFFILDFSKFYTGSRPNMCIGKAIPLQVWAGPEGSRMLKLPDFKTIGT